MPDWRALLCFRASCERVIRRSRCTETSVGSHATTVTYAALCRRHRICLTSAVSRIYASRTFGVHIRVNATNEPSCPKGRVKPKGDDIYVGEFVRGRPDDQEIYTSKMGAPEWNFRQRKGAWLRRLCGWQACALRRTIRQWQVGSNELLNGVDAGVAHLLNPPANENP